MTTRGSPLWTLVGSALVVLVLIGLILGSWLWRGEYRAASERAMRNAEFVARLTEQVLGTQVRLLQQADNHATLELVRSYPEAVSAHFAELIAADNYAIGLGLVAADSLSLVTSQMDRARMDASDRTYFQALRDTYWRVFVDRIEVQPGDQDGIVMAQRRAGEGSDGMLLLRHNLIDQPLRIQESAPSHAIMASGRSDIYQIMPTVDGITRLFATVPVAGFALYAVFGSPMTDLWATWRQDMILVAVSLAVLAALGLLLTVELRRRRQAQRSASLLAGSHREAERQAIFFQELNHRAKNNLQLGGTVTVRSANGVELTVSFPSLAGASAA